MANLFTLSLWGRVSSIKDSEKREEFLKNYYLWSKNTKTLLLPKALREKALAESPLSPEEIQNKFLNQLKEFSSNTQKDHFLKTYGVVQRVTQQHTFVQEARAYNAQKTFEQELETQTALNKEAPFSAQYGPYLKKFRHGLITQKPDLFFILVNHYHIDIQSLLGLYTIEELTQYSSLHIKSKSSDPITRLRALSELRRIPLRTRLPLF